MELQYKRHQIWLDFEDIPKLEAFSWHVSNHGYLMHKSRRFGTILFHRYVLNYKGELTIDHINGNRLDNRKCNLRVATQWENNLNQHKLPAHNSSGTIGVCWEKGKWVAFMSVCNKKQHIGTFPTKEEAIVARERFKQMRLAHPEQKPRERRLNNKSGIVGVSFWRHGQKWKAKWRGHHIGFFKTKEEAASALADWKNLDEGTI